MMLDGPRNTLRKSQAQRRSLHKEMEGRGMEIQCHVFSQGFFGWHSFRLAGLVV